MTDIDKNALTDILNGLVDSFDRETPDEITYKDFMKANKDSSDYDLFNTYEMAAFQHVFVMNKIIKQKYGIKRMSDDLYDFILEFPAYIKHLEREIEKAEGSSCCVDKAWTRSMARFKELVEANQAQEKS